MLPESVVVPGTESRLFDRWLRGSASTTNLTEDVLVSILSCNGARKPRRSDRPSGFDSKGGDSLSWIGVLKTSRKRGNIYW